MAIHPDVPGVHVEIIVDGKALKEYDDPDTEETSDSTTKYVEAESGKAFSILLKIKSDYQHSKYDLTRTVSVDGIRVGSSVYFKKEFNGSFEGAWHRMRSFRNGKHIEQQMLFSDLSVDDGEVHNISKDQMNNISMLGTVKVGLFRAICKGSGGVLTQSADFKETDKVSEKALKGRAVSHSVKLGEEKIVAPVNSCPTRYVDKGPLVSFIFKYRSKEALNSLHIIPRDPTPLPLEERPIEDLNPEEMRELLRRQKEAEANRIQKEKAMKQEKRLKRERRSSPDSVIGDDDDDDDVQIVEVRKNKRPRTSVPNNTDIIDLGD